MVNTSAKDILHIPLRSRSATEMGELDVSTTAVRPERQEKSDLGNDEDGSVIEGEDDGQRWVGGWRQRWQR
jgi:hypothetical protein